MLPSAPRRHSRQKTRSPSSHSRSGPASPCVGIGEDTFICRTPELAGRALETARHASNRPPTAYSPEKSPTTTHQNEPASFTLLAPLASNIRGCRHKGYGQICI